MELVRNRGFTFTTGAGKESRLRRLKNGFPQGSILAPLLFNIYTYDLPVKVGRKFAYADNLAILHYASNWQALESTLTTDIATLSSNLYKQKLKLCTTKTWSAAFHLYNRKERLELDMFVNGRAPPLCAEPIYLDIKQDRAITFCQHLESLLKKLISRVGPLKQLAKSSWGVDARRC